MLDAGGRIDPTGRLLLISQEGEPGRLLARRRQTLPRDWSDGEASTRFDGTPSGHKAGLPERRLMWAILQDAVNIMAAHRRTAAHHPGKLKRQTFGWMMSEDRCHVFAFENVCETLGLDADSLRAKVLGQQPALLHAIRRSVRDEPRDAR